MSASTGSADFVLAMGPVARELLGELNAGLSSPDELRFGSNGSKSVDLIKGTYYDHEVSKGGGVLDLVQVYKRLDKDGAIAWMQERGHIPKASPAKGGKGRQVAAYDYLSAASAPVFQVRRMEPKNFIQARADGKGGWVCTKGCMKGVELVIYRLPQTIEAIKQGKTIYICEGEKGVHSLESIGLSATCSPGGAGKWRKNYNSTFAGADVVVLPDNDPQKIDDHTREPMWHSDGRPVLPGQDHAADVARSLSGVAASVRVLMLPDLPLKGDVADWIAAGGTRQALDTMTEAAPVWGGADDWTDLDEPPPDFDDHPGYQAAADAAPGPDPIRALVAEFNGIYMVVSEAGRVILYKPDTDPVLNRRFYQRLEFADFQKMWMNRTIRNGVDKKGDPVFSQVAPLWLRHPDRRQFIGGVIFDPSGSNRDPEKLNLWQGFAVQHRPGSWAKMKDHIRNVICDGNSELNDYVLNWSARMVQFPAEQGEVAIVLKGVEGSGKGTLANALRRIMGQHALKISNAKHLVGNFNSHLRDCVFLFADEAFFAGDKQHVGVLKSIITEDSLTIEAKYANAVETPNYLHLMMASNEEWVVPAGLEARRFLVLLTTATKVRNFAYFKAIHAEMDNGGYEAMLHDLLNRDLTDFNVRDVPDTAGLQQQKKLSLGTSESWWLDVLHRGYVYRSKHGLESYFCEWHDVVTTEVLFASYTEFAKARNERHPMAREAFGRFMVEMGATPARHRNGVIGEHVADVTINQHGDTRRTAELVKKEMATGYRIGALEQARDAFQDSTKLTVEWVAAGQIEEIP